MFHVELGGGRSNAGGINRQGVHQQTEAELKQNLTRLVNEYKASHPVPPKASALVKKKRDDDAKQWAIKQEPIRDMPYLFESMEGVRADIKPRNVDGREYKGASSWVKSITRTSPDTVNVETKDGVYEFKANATQLEGLLKSGSIGGEVAKAINHDDSAYIKRAFRTPRSERGGK